MKEIKKEVDLHFAVLDIVLSRPEFKGRELTQKWIADFVGLNLQRVQIMDGEARKKISRRFTLEDITGED